MANQVVYGIAKDKNQAERIVQALMNAGVPNADISFLASNQNEQFIAGKRVGTVQSERNWRTEERLTDYPANAPEQVSRDESYMWDSSMEQKDREVGGLGHEKHTKAPEGATTGATTGGLIGGTLGLLAGIGALAIPGLGPFIAAGPLMATLAGIGGGGTLGGIIGALIGSGIPEYEAKRYHNRLTEGGVLIAVRVNSDSEAERVKKLLKDNGLEDVSISSEASMSKNYKK